MTTSLQFFRKIKKTKIEERSRLWDALSDWFFVRDLNLVQSDEIEKYLQKNQFLKSEALVICGVGGSVLGTKVICSLMASKKKIIFFDALDTLTFEKGIKQLLVYESLSWLFVSNSGNSQDVLAQINYLFPYFIKRKNFKSTALVVTGNKDGELALWAKKHQINTFLLSPDVCGRFSVLSPVGLIPSMFMGLDVKTIVEGAKAEFQQNDELIDSAQELVESFKRGELIHQCWVYSQKLEPLAYWFQQLWCETLFKKQKRSGQKALDVSLLQICRGPRDQHSLLQSLFSQRLQSYFVWVLTDPQSSSSGPILESSQFKLQKGLEGSQIGFFSDVLSQSFISALISKDISHLKLEASVLDERSLGSCLMKLQLLVGLIAEILEVDPFSQPEVDVVKIKISQFLSRLNL